jgi:hypothetical protein
MAFLVPNEGEETLLEIIVNKTAQSDLILRLYTNNYTPIETSTYSSFTEISGYDYGAITLTGGSWTVGQSVGESVASYDQQTFTMTSGPVVVYGYYLTKGTSKCILAERFTNGPYNVPVEGGPIKVTPKIKLD